MRLYIAGPMSSIKDLNYPEFNRVSRELSRMGHEVYNPATAFNGAYIDLPYDIWLREAVRLVSMVNGMVLLSGWDRSKGALTEIHIGLSLGMPFYSHVVGKASLLQLDMDFPRLMEAMNVYYLGGSRVESGGISEYTGGDSREAEGRQDHPFGSPAVGTTELDAALLRSTVEGGLPDDGSGCGRSQSDQRPTNITGHRFIFPWQRPVVVVKSPRPERDSGLSAGN